MTDLVVRDQAAILDRRELEEISKTDFVPRALRDNLPAIMACVATGRALGIPDMAALRSIHIVDGKATFSAELMVSLVRRAGHSITGEVGDQTVKVRGKRGDNGDELTVEWTLDMAKRAGLQGKQNWQRYPEAMLWARAVSQLCRMLFPDVFIGATYTPEEIGADATDEHGVPVDEIVGETVEADGLFPPLNALDPGGGTADGGLPASPPTDTKTATQPQKRKLNTLVGKLRGAGHDPTGWMYDTLGRKAEPSEDGQIHYSPLRDSLTKDEANLLIDQLEGFWQRIDADQVEF